MDVLPLGEAWLVSGHGVHVAWSPGPVWFLYVPGGQAATNACGRVRVRAHLKFDQLHYILPYVCLYMYVVISYILHVIIHKYNTKILYMYIYIYIYNIFVLYLCIITCKI